MNTVIFPDQDALLDVNLLRRMQQTYESLQSLAKLGGTGNYILSGCEVVGSNVSNGIVVINGEVLPFIGNTLIDTIIVVEEPLPVNSGGASLTEVNRYVTFGVGIGQIAFNSLRHNFATNKDFSKTFTFANWNMTTTTQEQYISTAQLFPDGGKTLNNITGIRGVIKNINLSNNGVRSEPYDSVYWGQTTNDPDGLYCNSIGFGDNNYNNVTVEITIFYK